MERSDRMEELDYARNARMLVQQDRMLGHHGVLLLLSACVLGALIWVSVVSFEQVVRGEGTIVPSPALQKIQYHQRGIISHIEVKEGDRVEKGQVLFQIDDTMSLSGFRELVSRREALRVQLARLEAEAHGTGQPAFETDLREKRPALVEREVKLFTARSRDLENQIARVQARLELAREERERLTIREDQGASGQDYPQVKREVTTLEGELERLLDGFRLTALTEYNETMAEIERLDEALSGRDGRVRRTKLRAPVTGVVRRLFANTIGSAVRPGEDLLELVPWEDGFLVEAKIRPRDRRFLRADQEVKLRFPAFELDGGANLVGRLETISLIPGRDVVDGEHFFTIRIRSEEDALRASGEKVALTTGMLVEVNVVAGRQTLLGYFAAPFQRVGRNALREPQQVY